MLAPLVFLLGLALVGQDGPSVSALVSAPGSPTVEAAMSPWDVDPVRPAATSHVHEVEEFPEEPEGDDEDDPGEAMDSKGRPSAFALVAGFDRMPLDAPPPPPPPSPPPPRGPEAPR
ncbi:hypothetical protein [Planctomyces sp. SH-PL62]|uniref:hypothetical protein n=1 Tax=Planctomyces sp. SH-PL62 TaxID=1636152 RepID=UPI00078D668F|nr:hypothetical protein [Planctomyces sp. SH-PL62]AMV40517.1 hypothetical protein VT85_24015 [Planctomyces sp. SH-PL62]